MAQLPAGMRNNNPGNIKYVGQAGTHPSINTDQGDPQAVYPSAEAGMAAMYSLLRRKYAGGKITANDIIAARGGWTPGNFQAAANVARTAGISATEDIGFNDPERAQRFMRGLLLQEHGPASNAYSDAMIRASIMGTPPPAGGWPTQTASVDYVASPVRHVGGAGSAPTQFETQPNYSLDAMPWDIFSNGNLPRMGTLEPPPMTPERFLMGMIGGQNPLRQMILGSVMKLFA